MSVEIEVITDVDRLERLRGPWNDLLDRVAGSNPYQSPAYVITWFRYYSAGKPIHVVAFRSDGELVGVAPFDVGRVGAGPLVVERLKSAASGRVDYGDPLLADWIPGLADLLLDHVHGVLARPGAAAYLRGLRSDGVLKPALLARDDLVAVPLADPLPAAVVRFDAMDDPVAAVRKIAQKRDRVPAITLGPARDRPGGRDPDPESPRRRGSRRRRPRTDPRRGGARPPTPPRPGATLR